MNTVAQIIGWIVVWAGGVVSFCWVIAALWELTPTGHGWGDIKRVAAMMDRQGRRLMFFGIIIKNIGVGIIASKPNPAHQPPVYSFDRKKAESVEIPPRQVEESPNGPE